MYNTGFYPPYQSNQFVRNEIIKVNGEGGAMAYQMQPNSSVLLLDETAPIVWLKTTDGAGYPSLVAYDIVPHKKEEQIINEQLTDRVEKLEKKFDELLGELNK